MPQSSILSYIARTSATFPGKVILSTPEKTQSSPEDVTSIDNQVTHDPKSDRNVLTTVQQVIACTRIPKQLPANVLMEPVNATHMADLKRLTSTTLPIRYPDKFYASTLEEPDAKAFSRVVLFDGRPVGWIRCRLDTVLGSDTENMQRQIYIQALCLLAPYRGQGFASALLADILNPSALKENNVESVYAHVWEANEEALEWYTRQNFNRVLLVDDYYRRLKPARAWIVRRDLG